MEREKMKQISIETHKHGYHGCDKAGAAHRVVSVEEGAATLWVRHTDPLAHDETRGTLAPFHTGSDVTFSGCCQVGAGRWTRRHALGVGAVGTTSQGCNPNTVSQICEGVCGGGARLLFPVSADH